MNTKTGIIDKIYIINLDRSAYRYENMKKQLNNLKLPVEHTRFSAVDGRKAKLVNVDTKEVITGEETFTNEKLLKGKFDIICSDEYSGDFNPVNLNLINFHPRTMGEVGVACSHKQIWQEIVTKGYKNTLIFEDDVTFIPNFEKHLEDVLHNLPTDYEYIYLFAFLEKDTFEIKVRSKTLQKILNFINQKFQNKFVRKVRRNITSAAGYIITLDGAKNLLENSKQYKQIDEIIRELIQENKLNAYVTDPLLLKACEATQKGCDTNIGIFPNHKSSNDLVGK